MNRCCIGLIQIRTVYRPNSVSPRGSRHQAAAAAAAASHILSSQSQSYLRD